MSWKWCPLLELWPDARRPRSGARRLRRATWSARLGGRELTADDLPVPLVPCSTKNGLHLGETFVERDQGILIRGLKLQIAFQIFQRIVGRALVDPKLCGFAQPLYRRDNTRGRRYE